MKYCINYFNTSKYLNTIDELIIEYYPKETSFLQFLDEHKSQTVHMRVHAGAKKDFLDNEIAVLTAIRAQHPDYNFYVCIPFDLELVQALTDSRINFWFSNFIVDWDTLNYYLSLGVSYISIVENLCFDIDKVANLAHMAGAKVRVLPNVAQTAARAYTPAIQKFFIRPEDIPLYEKYVDVCDFYCSETTRQDVYYKIYAYDKQWYGNLREIIIDLGEDIDNRCILTTFALHRINCGKKCMKGAHCTVCLRHQAMSTALKKNNLIVKPPLS